MSAAFQVSESANRCRTRVLSNCFISSNHQLSVQSLKDDNVSVPTIAQLYAADVVIQHELSSRWRNAVVDLRMEDVVVWFATIAKNTRIGISVNKENFNQISLNKKAFCLIKSSFRWHWKLTQSYKISKRKDFHKIKNCKSLKHSKSRQKSKHD